MALFNRNDIALRLGAKTVNDTYMEEYLALWASMYSDSAPWLSDNVKSLNLSFAVCRELARLVTLEFSSEINGSLRAEYLSAHYGDIVRRSPEWVEYAAALGGVILKPYISDRGIESDIVRADAFYPTAFDSAGRIRGCIFCDKIVRGGKYYTRLECHELDGNRYKLKNKAYVSNTVGAIGREIPLTEIAEWAELAEEAELGGVNRMLFSYMRILGSNPSERYTPLGCSVFAPAVSLIEQADRQYSRLLWEYEGSELAVFVDDTMLNTQNKLPKVSKRLFRGLNSSADNLIEPFSPTIRDTSLINGLNTLLRRIEFLCGLAYGTFSDVDDTPKTATEIKASRQRSYAMVSSLQRAVKDTLTDYAKVLDVMCDLYNLVPKGQIEQSFDFDDSLVTDSESEQRIWLQEVSAGLMKPETYLMKRYGYTENQALQMLPSAFPDE